MTAPRRVPAVAKMVVDLIQAGKPDWAEALLDVLYPKPKPYEPPKPTFEPFPAPTTCAECKGPLERESDCIFCYKVAGLAPPGFCFGAMFRCTGCGSGLTTCVHEVPLDAGAKP